MPTARGIYVGMPELRDVDPQQYRGLPDFHDQLARLLQSCTGIDHYETSLGLLGVARPTKPQLS